MTFASILAARAALREALAAGEPTGAIRAEISRLEAEALEAARTRVATMTPRSDAAGDAALDEIRTNADSIAAEVAARIAARFAALVVPDAPRLPSKDAGR